ncbi:MAG: PqqD family protein [Bacteroidales bacterium]|nr:PqqD family protein [Bacteroidales bacterium]
MKIKSNIAISDSGFLLNPSSGESFSLNPMGVMILKMVKEGKSLQEMSTEISQDYDVNQSILERDIEDFKGTLMQHGILEKGEDD